MMVASASSKKVLLWVSIASMVMLFAGITSGYIVRKGEGNWLHFEMPFYFVYSTAVMLFSSFLLNIGINKVKSDEDSSVYFGLTLLCGLVFALLQYLGWRELYAQKVFFAGSQSNAAGSFFYVITGFHLAHLLGGLISMAIVFVKSSKSKYSSVDYSGASLAAIYWHFLDLLWVYLFLFLYLSR